MDELLTDVDLDEPAATRPPKTHRIEQAIVLMANSVWALVGLILWVPQIVRVVITSALRLIHAALTRQPIDSIRGPIREVSRFYIDGFLSFDGEPRTAGYSRRQLQLGRFLVEALWVVAVWLLVLRLVDQEAFSSVWTWLAASSAAVLDRLLLGVVWVVDRLPGSARAFLDLGTVGSVAIVVLLVAFLIAGFALGRRR